MREGGAVTLRRIGGALGRRWWAVSNCRFVLDRTRALAALRSRNRGDASPVGVPKASGFFDRTARDQLIASMPELQRFHPELRDMLLGNSGLRAWEYGMLLHGLPRLEGRDVLDVGCGPSLFPMYLSRCLRARVTILDLAAPYTIELEALRRRAEEHDVTLQIGDMRAMPFVAESFDVVLSVSAIEHLSHSADHEWVGSPASFVTDTRRTLHELYRVLRPGGWLYLTSEAYCPGRVHYDNWAGRLTSSGAPYGAYRLDDIASLFVDTLRKLGASFPYPLSFDPALLVKSRRYASYRNRFITAFNLYAVKPPGPHGADHA